MEREEEKREKRHDDKSCIAKCLKMENMGEKLFGVCCTILQA